MAKKKPKFYVVWKGHKTGIFTSWPQCQSQIKGYPSAQYKSFESKVEAEKAFRDGYSFTPSTKKKTTSSSKVVGTPVWKSISVDAACSGNPGDMEYQGVDTTTGKRLFHQGPFPQGTNNIGEFLALVHGLAYLKKINSSLPIYSDSKIAIGWVKKKKMKTTVQPSAKNRYMFELIDRAEKWLQSNTYTTKILKWETKAWGEIPADFGRK